MRERQSRRVQEGTLESLYRADIARHPAVNTAIQRIPHNRMADRTQVHADLMRASGVNRDLTQRESRQMMCARDPCDCFARVLGPRRHLLSMDWIAPDRGVVRAITAGGEALAKDAALDIRLATLKRLQGSYPDAYGPGYLATLREDWPA